MDDFDRFCQMAHTQAPQTELLPPSHLSRNRASSLRDNNRRRSSKQAPNVSQLKGSMDQGIHNGHRRELPSVLSPPRPEYGDRRYPQDFLSKGTYNQMDFRRGSSPNPTIITHSHNNSPSKFEVPEGFNSSHRSSVVRVRSFKRTKGGHLINRGDRDITVADNPYEPGNSSTTSLSPRQSLSGGLISGRSRMDDHIVNQWTPEMEILPKGTVRSRSNSKAMEPPIPPAQLKVQVIGAEQVGKTMLVNQFLQSESVDESVVDSGEFIHAYLSTMIMKEELH
ncbi:hypothetical protein Ciccas_000815 [Cichlidogyrus casuarinus]|uniref:Uncharacterized protein n=1 Tax=Cichlidogyrus casuarinus TaxID=1844966 RepID=A0ABD2QP36_9PLAT